MIHIILIFVIVSSTEGRRGNGGFRGKRTERGRGRGKGYIKEMMETRRRVENYEYMDDSSIESDRNERRGKAYRNERPPPGLRGKALGNTYIPVYIINNNLITIQFIIFNCYPF